MDAHLAVALDPDADRCALGIPAVGGGWRMLTGDETGALLGDHLLRNLDRAAHPDPLVATTIVSGELLRSIAEQHGARYDETLTGFKWIVRAGDGRGTGLVFGYEEALGLCVDPDQVRDKDGISAAVLACDLVAGLQATGHDRRGPAGRARPRPTGWSSPANSRSGWTTWPRSLKRWRALRRSRPATLLGDPVTEVTDLLPRTDGLRLRTARARVVIRPSGTEPKLKCYLQLTVAVPPDADLTAIRTAAAADLAALTSEMADLVDLTG